MMRETWRGKTVLVVGLARSGIAAAELLMTLGARPVLSDAREDIQGLSDLEAGGARVCLGVPAEGLLPGADAVIVSPGVPLTAPVIQRARALGVPVYGELAFAAGLMRGAQVAITGTNGKTTTASLLGEMLSNAGRMAYVAGNIGLPLSAVAPLTKPEDYTVIEVSSFQLEHVGDFHPQGAAILNLTPDHLNRHGTMEAYGALKEGMLQNQTGDDFFVYNADDAFCRAVASRAKARAVPFSRLAPQRAGACVADGRIMLSGRALLRAEDLSLPGPHNLENALAAAAMAGELGLPAAVVRHTLRTFAGIRHRMETVRVARGVRWINDSKGTNPESSLRGVEGMRVPTVLIAGGDEKGSDFAGFARAIAQNGSIQTVVLIGKTAGRIERALLDAGYTHILRAGEDFEKAVRLAGERAVRGGAVLLSPACASFDMFKDFEARGDAFRALVAALPDD